MIDTPNYAIKQQYQEMLDAIQEPKAQRQMDSQQTLSEIEAPPCKSCKRTLDMNPGEYACFRFAKTAFQGNPHTILFLLQANENGEQVSDVETPCYGYFLEKELIGKDLSTTLLPLHCHLGDVRTTNQKHKDHLPVVA